MLPHPLVIALLIGRFAAAAVMIYAAWKGVYALRYWSADSSSALQLDLEREHYLLGAAVQVAVAAQIIDLALFVWLINNYLPDVIRGAMCGAGTLSANQYGYPLLYVKVLTPPLYAFYLLLQYLDNREPSYPLTPFKYYFLVPTALIALAELWLMCLYFYRISPDVIVTCCSVDFLSASSSEADFLSGGRWLQPALWGWGIVGVLLAAADWHKPFLPAWLHAFLTAVFVGLSLYTLKYFFVKYIYGLPSHLCLFDLFLSHHRYIGYPIFALYYVLVITALFTASASWLRSRLHAADMPLRLWASIRLVALLLTLLIPLAYRVMWSHGTL